jgi:DNA-binding response OmpR family regulator
MPLNGKPTFIVIDDDRLLSSLIQGILRDADFEHLGSAENGEAGLKACLDKQPDLVMLDINLPGADGLEVLMRIKQLKQAPKVIMVSSEATTPHVKTALARGADGFVVKPFTAAKLLAQVENAFRRR